MAVIVPGEIWHRGDFGLLCFWRKLWPVCEVGIDRGEFAHAFLCRCPCGHYWGIDSYEAYPKFGRDRLVDMMMCARKLEPFSERVKVIRERSAEAASMFPDGFFGFVYIDGGHDHTSVRSDLQAWLPKVADHGIIAGHDWTDQPEHSGVKPAVIEMAESIGQTIYTTSVPGYEQEVCPSWYVYKSGMPGPDWQRC